MNIEESTNQLEGIIKEAMDIVAPITTKILSKKTINQWLTLGLKISLKQSNNLYRKWRKNRNPESIVEYKKYKNILDKLIRISKNDHNEGIIKRAGPDTRKLWSIINEIIDPKQCKHKLPNRFVINGQTIRNKTNIAKAFNEYFASIGRFPANRRWL